MAVDICAKFVSKKVRKVRWKPRDTSGNPNPEYFITGSWDDKENEIALWHCPYDENREPILISSSKTICDVNDINFYDASTFAIAMGNGSVALIKIQGEKLELLLEWKNIHKFRHRYAPCTGVVAQPPDFASVGEDGNLNLYRLMYNMPYKTIEADSCTVNAVIFISQSEILTGNSRGTIKVWDLRSSGNKPAQTSCLTEDSEIGVSSIDRHPFQGHIVAVGGYDGTLAMYDMRKTDVPVTLLAGPESCLTQVRFHPDNSDQLFTSTECGSLWSWSSIEEKSIRPGSCSNGSVWLSGDLTAQQLDIKEVLPPLPLAINSIDVCGERLVCGGDNEAFYYISRLLV